MYIEYKGPGSATLALSEGAYCATEDGCDVSGPDVLGARRRAAGAAGRHPVPDRRRLRHPVAPGENPSWLMTTTGLDQATTLGLAAKLAEVGG